MLFPLSRRAFTLATLAIPNLLLSPDPLVPTGETISTLQAGVSDLYSDKAAESVAKLLKALEDPAFGAENDAIGRGSIYRLLGDASSVLVKHADSFGYYSSAVDSLTGYEPSADDAATVNSELSLSLIGKARAAYGVGVPSPPSPPSSLAKDLERGIALSCTSDYEDDLLLCGGNKNPFLLWELGRARRDAALYLSAADAFKAGKGAFKRQGDNLRSYLCECDEVLARMEADDGYKPPASAYDIVRDSPKEFKSRELAFFALARDGREGEAEEAAKFEQPSKGKEEAKRGWTLDDDFDRVKGGRKEWEKIASEKTRGKLPKA